MWPFGGAFLLLNSFFIFLPIPVRFMVALAGVFSLLYLSEDFFDLPVALVVTEPCHYPPPIFWVVPGLAFMYGFNKLCVLVKP